MKENEVISLIRGLAPRIRDVVTEAVAPFTARLAELEARPIEKGDTGERGADGPPGPPGPSGELAMVPPDLAEQIKNAIHLLHESPPIVKRDDQPKWPSPPRVVARIDRDGDGNFVPIYDETQP
jgi:hypothetical protein